ncbi:MAG: hypothetical protein ACLFP4_16150 [Spirochaetales bacterium]
MSKKYPDLYYEQYVLGELPEPLARELERSEEFQRRIDEISRSNDEILTSYPAENIAKQIRNDYEAKSPSSVTRPRSSTNRIFTLALPAAAALALAFFMVSNFSNPTRGTVIDQTTEQVRLKGASPTLRVFRSEGMNGSLVALEDGSQARAGDALQVAYDSATAPYGAVFSIDGRGNVTLHYPLDASANPRLEGGGVVTLPRSFVLDDAPLFERFYLVTSDQPFDVDRLLSRVRRQTRNLIADTSAQLDLGNEYQLSHFTVEKEQ